MDEHSVVRLASNLIKKGDCDGLMNLHDTVILQKLDRVYILQKSYLNACIYGTPRIIRYLFKLAHSCSEIDKIRLRPAFFHSRYTIGNFDQAELNALIRGLYPNYDPTRSTRMRR